MKIAFYADHPYYGQLANNGGTRTILLSVKALRELGHDACVVAHKDRFTWFSHDKPVREMPKDADVIVAVSISDLDQLIHADHGDARLAYWARPVETWQMPWEHAEMALRKLMKRHGRIMANSGWQVADLVSKEVPCTLIHAGMDPCWEERKRAPDRPRRYAGPFVVGWQHSMKLRKGSVDKLHNQVGKEAVWMAFGSESWKDKWADHYSSNLTSEELVAWYNHCDIFVCPNTHEGFYNCGAEAALCGCALLVDARQAKGGTSDYATTDSAMMYRDTAEAVKWLRKPDFGKIPVAQAKLRAIGDRKTNMARMVEVLSAD